MELTELRQRFIPAIEEILDQCRIAEGIVDKEKFQVFIATIWGNAVLEPERSGIEEGDLSSLHDFLNEEIARISFYVEPACSAKKDAEIRSALGTIAENTVLIFYENPDDPELRYLCSEVAPKPEERGHFIAGEGGPSKIINTSIYAVILSGKVSLFRSDKCVKPQIALHETLHALGFDHNNADQDSIMYPITRCQQTLDQYLIDEIDRVYSVESKPDLAIENINANKTGRYLNFDLVVANIGLEDADESIVKVIVDNEEINDFDLGSMSIGTRRFLNVKNLRIPRNTDEIVFIVELTQGSEISTSNNIARLNVIESNV